MLALNPQGQGPGGERNPNRQHSPQQIPISTPAARSISKKEILWFNHDPRQFKAETLNFNNAKIEFYAGNHEQTRFSKNENVVAIVVDYQTPVLEKHIYEFPNLKLIVTQTSRTEHIKIKKPGITIERIGGEYCADTIADKCLYVAEKFSYFNDYRIDSVGIIGMGTLGRSIAKQFSDKKVYFFDPKVEENNIGQKSTIAEIARIANLIILVCPTNSRSISTLSKRTTFGRKPIIFNLSGPTVCMKSFLDFALTTKRITAYWFDFGTSDIRRNNFLITPHTAWRSLDSLKRRHEETMQKLIKILNLKITKED